MCSSDRRHPAASRSAAMSSATAASGTLAGVMPTTGTSPVRVTQRVPLVPVNQHRAGLAAVPHVAVLHAHPPVPGHPAAQRRHRAGAVHVLVAHLPGDRHRRGRGRLPGPSQGNERPDLIQQAQHPGQRRIPAADVPRPFPARLQAGGRLRRHPASPPRQRCRRPAPAPAARDHAQGLTQGVSHQVKRVLHPARAPDKGLESSAARSARAPNPPVRARGQLHRPLEPGAGPGHPRSAA